MNRTPRGIIAHFSRPKKLGGKVGRHYIFPLKVWEKLWDIVRDIHREYNEINPARTEWLIGCEVDQWIVKLFAKTCKFRIKISSTRVCYEWLSSEWLSFVRCVCQKPLRNMAVFADSVSANSITFYFTKENRNFELPLDVWYNIQECQERLDHVVDLSLYDEWDVSDVGRGNVAWTLWVSTNPEGEYFVHLRAKAKGLRGCESVIDWTYEEWKKLKDCMITANLCDDMDFRLAVYVLADIIRQDIERMSRDKCDCCNGRADDERHKCILGRNVMWSTLYPKALSNVKLIDFKEQFRRSVVEYNVYADAPALLFHHILRHHGDKIRQLVVLPDVFADPD